MSAVHAARAERFARQRDGASLCCVRDGSLESQRGLFFLNGLYYGPEAWIKQRRYGLFKRSFRMLLHDYRGFGGSTCAPGSSFGMSELVQDAVHLIAAEQVPEAVVIGHSIGCAVALACAAEHAATVRAVVLLAAGMRVSPRLRVMLEAIGGLLREGVPFARLYPFALAWHHSERYLEKLTAQQTQYADAVSGYINDPSALEALYHDLLADDIEERFQDVASRVRVPVLIVSAAEDMVFPPGMQHEVAALLPQSRLVILESGGHAIQVEQHAAVNRAIEELLVEVGLVADDRPSERTSRGGGA